LATGLTLRLRLTIPSRTYSWFISLSSTLTFSHSGQTDGTLVADSYLVHVTNIASTISEILCAKDTERYRSDHLKLKKAYQHKYVTRAGFILGDTQTALSLAIEFDLLDNNLQLTNATARLARAVRMAQFKVSTGFVGTPIICHALTKSGLPQLAYRMLLNKACPSWMYPIEQGATSIWERWDSMLPDGSINPGAMTSFNHYALGSIVNWLHTTVGGISPLEPGWKTIRVRPVPGGTITSANVRFESPYGRITCAWKIEQGIFKMVLEIPPNSKARVTLPNQPQGRVFEQKEEGSWYGSGRYEFTCQWQPEQWPPLASLPPFWSQCQPEHV
jgi:alpha-L-rhamnosidase